MILYHAIKYRVAYQKEREGVQRQAGAVEPKTVKPALHVLERVHNGCPGELLIQCGVAIRSKPFLDASPLLLRDESRRFRIVLDKPVCPDGAHACGNTLL